MSNIHEHLEFKLRSEENDTRYVLDLLITRNYDILLIYLENLQPLTSHPL